MFMIYKRLQIKFKKILFVKLGKIVERSDYFMQPISPVLSSSVTVWPTRVATPAIKFGGPVQDRGGFEPSDFCTGFEPSASLSAKVLPYAAKVVAKEIKEGFAESYAEKGIREVILGAGFLAVGLLDNVLYAKESYKEFTSDLATQIQQALRGEFYAQYRRQKEQLPFIENTGIPAPGPVLSEGEQWSPEIKERILKAVFESSKSDKLTDAFMSQLLPELKAYAKTRQEAKEDYFLIVNPEGNLQLNL
jgi:hypothetical protein